MAVEHPQPSHPGKESPAQEAGSPAEHDDAPAQHDDAPAEHDDAPAEHDDAPTPRVGRAVSLGVAAYLLIQIVVPAAYYVGERHVDERFRWRMFSTTQYDRLSCTLAVEELPDEGDATAPTTPPARPAMSAAASDAATAAPGRDQPALHPEPETAIEPGPAATSAPPHAEPRRLLLHRLLSAATVRALGRHPERVGEVFLRSRCAASPGLAAVRLTRTCRRAGGGPAPSGEMTFTCATGALSLAGL